MITCGSGGYPRGRSIAWIMHVSRLAIYRYHAVHQVRMKRDRSRMQELV
jgi:hypothetical protein